MLYKASPRTDIRMEGVFLTGLLLPHEEGYPPPPKDRTDEMRQKILLAGHMVINIGFVSFTV